MLALIVFLPLLAFAAILLGAPARTTAIAAAAINLLLGAMAALTSGSPAWEISLSVLAQPDIRLAFGFIDGMSVVMILLSVIVTLAAVATGQAPAGREKLYYGSSLLISSGALGAFASTDLFFFYAFHELALVPTFITIGLLGRGERRAVAWKITLYLGFASLILLAGLLWLVQFTGTFSIPGMLAGAVAIDVASQKAIAALLLIGFGTLVSLFPFHSWAAPAYASAPAPIAMLHAGVLKKFGLYGLLRLAVPLLPEGMQTWLTPLLVLLLGNILWVGWITISQRRLDTLLGNSSVMHMGYLFLALAVGIANPASTLAIPGAVVLMFAHGISIALFFALADRLERATGTLEFDALGGLAKSMPALSFLFGIAAMASLGLPGLANFAGEILVFLAAFENYDPSRGFAPVQIACILSLWGVVLSAVYLLRAYRRIFQGPEARLRSPDLDLALPAKLPLALLAAALLAVGLYPNLLLNLLK